MLLDGAGDKYGDENVRKLGMVVENAQISFISINECIDFRILAIFDILTWPAGYNGCYGPPPLQPGAMYCGSREQQLLVKICNAMQGQQQNS